MLTSHHPPIARAALPPRRSRRSGGRIDAVDEAVWSHVFGYLVDADVEVAGAVSRSLLAASRQRGVWAPRLRARFPDDAGVLTARSARGPARPPPGATSAAAALATIANPMRAAGAGGATVTTADGIVAIAVDAPPAQFPSSQERLRYRERALGGAPATAVRLCVPALVAGAVCDWMDAPATSWCVDFTVTLVLVAATLTFTAVNLACDAADVSAPISWWLALAPLQAAPLHAWWAIAVSRRVVAAVVQRVQARYRRLAPLGCDEVAWQEAGLDAVTKDGTFAAYRWTWLGAWLALRSVGQRLQQPWLLPVCVGIIFAGTAILAPIYALLATDAIAPASLRWIISLPAGLVVILPAIARAIANWQFAARVASDDEAVAANQSACKYLLVSALWTPTIYVALGFASPPASIFIVTSFTGIVSAIVLPVTVLRVALDVLFAINRRQEMWRQLCPCAGYSYSLYTMLVSANFIWPMVYLFSQRESTALAGSAVSFHIAVIIAAWACASLLGKRHARAVRLADRDARLQTAVRELGVRHYLDRSAGALLFEAALGERVWWCRRQLLARCGCVCPRCCRVC